MGSSGESPLDRLTSTMPYQSRIPRRDRPPNLFPFPGLEALLWKECYTAFHRIELVTRYPQLEAFMNCATRISVMRAFDVYDRYRMRF